MRLFLPVASIDLAFWNFWNFWNHVLPNYTIQLTYS